MATTCRPVSMASAPLAGSIEAAGLLVYSSAKCPSIRSQQIADWTLANCCTHCLLLHCTTSLCAQDICSNSSGKGGRENSPTGRSAPCLRQSYSHKIDTTGIPFLHTSRVSIARSGCSEGQQGALCVLFFKKGQRSECDMFEEEILFSMLLECFPPFHSIIRQGQSSFYSPPSDPTPYSHNLFEEDIQEGAVAPHSRAAFTLAEAVSSTSVDTTTLVSLGFMCLV